MNRLVAIILPLLIALAIHCSPPAKGQTDRQTELGIRQKLVEQKMLELESKFTSAAEKIREQDPQRADRLVQTYQKAREESLAAKMAQASAMLDKDDTAGAEQLLDEIIEILERLIRQLTNEQEKEATKQETIERLEQFQKQLQQRMDEQSAQATETEKVSDREKTLETLQEQMEQLENLIKAQKKAIGASEEAGDASLRKLDAMADEQFEIRKETERLKAAIADQSDEEATPSDSEPTDGTESESEDSKPGEGKPGEESPSGEKPKEGKPGEGKPSEGKPSEGKPV